jgi:hypothetical protein
MAIEVGWLVIYLISWLIEVVIKTEIKLKSLILAQIERWRNALHMQVERQRGATWRRAADG